MAINLGLNLTIESSRSQARASIPAPAALDPILVYSEYFCAKANPVGYDAVMIDVNTAADFTGTVIANNQEMANGLYSVPNLTPGTTYYYRVRGVIGSKVSKNSNVITIKIHDWSPSQLPGINAWFDNDPNTFTLDTDKVTEWRDKIYGSTKKYYQNVANSQPSWSSSKKSIVFDRLHHLRRTQQLSAVSNITFIYVVKLNDNTNDYQYIGSHNGTNPPGQISTNVRFDYTSLMLQAGTGLNAYTTSFAKLSADFRLMVFNYVRNSETSKIIGYACATNGGNIVGSGNPGGRQFSGADLYLGSKYDGTYGLDGEVKAMISVLGTLSTDDLNLLSAYVNQYYLEGK